MQVWISGEGEPLPFPAGDRVLRYGELSRSLAAAGHRVTWWGSDFSHHEKSYIGEPGSRVLWNGVDIELIHGSAYRRNVSLARLRYLAVHARNLERTIAQREPPHVIVAGMPSIESCEVLVSYGKRHNVPVIVDIHDEWPEDYVRWLPRPLRPFGRLVLVPKFRQLQRACRGATAIFGVTGQQLHYGLRHAGRGRAPMDAVFYIGAPAPTAEPAAKLESDWRSRGVSDAKFTCIFAGTLARSRPLAPVIDAVIRLSGQIPISLIVAGSGEAESAYRRQAGGHPAIRFVGWIDHASLTVLLAMADVLLAPYDPSWGFSMPTKIFDYMAAGRPILSSCPGETWALIEEFGFGCNYRFDSTRSVETALKGMFADPARRKEMGRIARRLFEQRFDLSLIVERYSAQLKRIVEANRA
jgi:glycosyltransferase involved in cell wall biosynthesis